MKTERDKFIEALNKNNLCTAERQQAKNVIEESDIKAHGRTIPFSYIPLILNGEDVRYFESVIAAADRILSKVTRRYVEDPEYRKLFGFSEQMEKLILLPCNYETVIPVGRYDIFYDENSGEYQFCEFNTDGSGGMSRDFEISDAILKSFADRQFVEDNQLRTIPVIDIIVKNFLKIYFSDKNAVEHPVFCITDFREEGVFSDFERFIKAFRQHGIEARFTDIRDLQFDGEHLYDSTDGTVINAIYRRAVTSVILERIDECQGLIRAVEEEKIVLLGHFRTSVVHSKMIHSVLHHEETMKMLDADERNWVIAHIPLTCPLVHSAVSGELLSAIYTQKDNWVLKPKEGFGSHGVVCGMDVSIAEWRSLIDESFDSEFLIQSFCERYAVPVLGTDDREITEMPLMLGMYCSGGHFVGCYSRAGNEGTIDFDHNGICVSTLISGEMQENKN